MVTVVGESQVYNYVKSIHIYIKYTYINKSKLKKFSFALY